MSKVEEVVAPAAIERALGIYQQLQHRDQSVLLQARKIVTQHIYGMIDKGEFDEQRLTVGGLARLKSIERDHDILSASESTTAKGKPRCAAKAQPIPKVEEGKRRKLKHRLSQARRLAAGPVNAITRRRLEQLISDLEQKFGGIGTARLYDTGAEARLDHQDSPQET